MLLMMAAQPGDDMGNVVAWKDFKTPDPSIIVPKIIDFRVKSSKCANQAFFIS
jgi:hypothetical protein